ncbi:DUF6350 family protein, partial [Streptomyces sp. WAC07061]|uniref:cell division protein PerM n=1 Tax=Streptomyces sp. WAC07061 TaxID=2487410 RepID=UPI0034D2DF91
GETALTAALGALVCGLAMAGLAAASAGPLGSRMLAGVGPVWWAVGGAAAVWTLVLAVPLAVGVQVWRTRPVRSAEGDAWHDPGVRELRWEALRRAADPLVAPAVVSPPASPPVVVAPEPIPQPVPDPVPVAEPVLPVAVAGARVLARRRPES